MELLHVPAATPVHGEGLSVPTEPGDLERPGACTLASESAERCLTSADTVSPGADTVAN